jgi:hypothetical protein
MHLIDVEFGSRGHNGESWITEEEACRKFRPALLKFWDREGGRETIQGRGGTINENTIFLIHKIINSEVIDSPQSGRVKTYHVAWVGYGHEANTWEPETAIPEALLQEFNRKQRRKQLCY